MLPLPDIITSLVRSFSTGRDNRQYIHEQTEESGFGSILVDRLQTSLEENRHVRKIFSAMRKGISWMAWTPYLTPENAKQLAIADRSMEQIIAPFIFPSLIGKSIKFCCRAASITSRRKSMKDIGKLALLGGSITCKSIKAVIWMDEARFFISNEVHKNLTTLTTIISPMLLIGKIFDSIENLMEIVGIKVVDGVKLEKVSDQQKFLLFKLAHQITSLALAIIECLAFLLGLIFSPILVLCLSTFELVCKTTKFFFRRQNKLDQGKIYTKFMYDCY